MKGMILGPEEVRAVLEAGKVTVRRVVRFASSGSWEPANRPEYCPVGSFVFVDLADPCGTYPTYVRCSFVPGERRFVKETLSVHCDGKRSRLTIVNVSTRVERLREITEDGARNAGIVLPVGRKPDGTVVQVICVSDQHCASDYADDLCHAWTYRAHFAAAWDSRHRKPGHQWASNPFVWVGEFERVER